MWLVRFLVSALTTAEAALVALRIQQGSLTYKQVVIDVWDSSTSPVRSFALPALSIPSKGTQACTLPGFQTESGGEGALTRDADGLIWLGCRDISVNSSLATAPAPVVFGVFSATAGFYPYASTNVYPNGTNILQVLNGGSVLYTIGGGSPTLNNQAYIHPITNPESPLVIGPNLQTMFLWNETLYGYGYTRTDGAVGVRVPAVLQMGAPGRPPQTGPVSWNVVRSGQYRYGSVISENQDSVWYVTYAMTGSTTGGGFRLVKENTYLNTTQLFGLPGSGPSAGGNGGLWYLQAGRYEDDFTVYLTNGGTIMKNTYGGLVLGRPYGLVAAAPVGWTYRGIVAEPMSPSVTATPRVLPSRTSTSSATGTRTATATGTQTATASSKSTVTSSATRTSITTQTSMATNTPLPSSAWPTLSPWPTVSPGLAPSSTASSSYSSIPSPSAAQASQSVAPSASQEIPSSSASPSPSGPKISPSQDAISASASTSQSYSSSASFSPSASPSQSAAQASQSAVPSPSAARASPSQELPSASSSASPSASPTSPVQISQNPPYFSESSSASASASATASGTATATTNSSIPQPAAAPIVPDGILSPAATIGVSTIAIVAAVAGIGILIYKVQFLRSLRKKSITKAVVVQNPLTTIELPAAPVYRPASTRSIFIADTPQEEPRPQSIFLKTFNNLGGSKKEFKPVLSSRAIPAWDV
jgi:hypothetical protein